MSTPNFSYENRCVVVTNADLESGNHPEILDSYDNRGSYTSYIIETKNEFDLLKIVLISGYYSDACLTIVDEEECLEELWGLHCYYFDTVADAKAAVCGTSKMFSKSFIAKHFAGFKKSGLILEDFLREKLEALRPFVLEKEMIEANKELDYIKEEYGYEEVCCVARFSNGGAMYDYVK